MLSRIVFKRQRGRRLLAALATVTLVTGLVGSAVFAANTTLVNFEIDGDLPATATTGSEDWVHTGNTGVDSATSALKCANNAATCAPTVPAAGLITNVVDGSGLGSAELYRDWLKVDPDHTTFTNGDKENDYSVGSVVCPVSGACSSNTPWHIVTGSVPPNKDDLFDVATNTYISGDQSELDIGMIRTNNNGSSHVDFELNRANWTPGSTGAPACATDTTGITGFKCPKRTEGDLLISFEISPSGAGVTVATRYFVWDLPGGIDAGAGKRPTSTLGCDGPLTGNENTCPWEEISAPSTTVLVAGVNPADMAAQPWGNRLPSGAVTATIPQGGWFEAGLDLDALGFPPSCPGFGTASAKSRSSGSSVTSALTDLAGPFPINLNNCADITIVKVTDPAGSSQSFNFATTGTGYTTPFSLTDQQSHASGPLNPGTYTAAETVPAGWSQVSAVCSDGSPVTAISLQALEHITCTFTNRARGHIIVDKVTDPSGSSQSFSFTTTGTGYSGFSLTDAATPNDSGELVPGAYSVAETAVAGWDLTSATCDGGQTPASITLAAGATIHCTFNNRQRGHIIVDKVTDPSGSSQSFDFTTTGTGYSGFSLTDAATPNDSGELVPGAYSVAETAVAGWDLTSATCDGGQTPASITLAAGATIHCTFNNRQRGHIIVDKVTDPSGSSQSFDFTTTGTGYSGFSLTDAATPNDSGLLVPGAYSVAETPVTGWTLTSSSCDGTGNTPASITLTAGATVHCTFNNRTRGAIKILKESTKTGNPLVSTAGAVFSYGTNLSVTDNGAGDEDPTVGSVCVSGLVPGNYTVNETTPPTGYGSAPGSQADQIAAAAVGTDCTTSLPTGAAVVTFTNPPLSDIQVRFRDGGSGETSATISCDNSTGLTNSGPTTGWDTTQTITGVNAPVTVVCTIVIDP